MLRRKRGRSFFAIIILLLILGALWWRLGLGFDPIQNLKNAFKPSEAPSGTITSNSAEPTGDLGAVPSSKDGLVLATPVSAFREGVILQTENEAEQLLPEAVGAGSVKRFWFYSDTEFYVEYQRKGLSLTDRMAFLTAVGSPPNLDLARISLYGLGASGWGLIDGKEVLFSKPQKDLYEKNSKGVWVKMN